jgi:glutamine amidotransferase
MRVSIVDYGLSNLLSVQRAVRYLGHEPVLAETADAVREADVLLLPGVGAFADGMAGLAKRGMLRPIQSRAAAGVSILGICLGMQMLFTSSRENGVHQGLGLIPGCVERIPGTTKNGARLRVPHIGCERLLTPGGISGTQGLPLRGTGPEDEFYFAHSFAARPEDRSHILAECDYGGARLCAAAGSGSVFGTQFHPEKSGQAGLRVLDDFLRHGLFAEHL